MVIEHLKRIIISIFEVADYRDDIYFGWKGELKAVETIFDEMSRLFHWTGVFSAV